MPVGMQIRQLLVCPPCLVKEMCRQAVIKNLAMVYLCEFLARAIIEDLQVFLLNKPVQSVTLLYVRDSS